MTASSSSDTALALHLALFSHVACRPELEIDLGQAALLIAEPEYDDLDVAVYLRTLDRLADQVRPRLLSSGEPTVKAAALLGFLSEEEGFRGNTAEYDDHGVWGGLTRIERRKLRRLVPFANAAP